MGQRGSLEKHPLELISERSVGIRQNVARTTEGTVSEKRFSESHLYIQGTGRKDSKEVSNARWSTGDRSCRLCSPLKILEFIP